MRTTHKKISLSLLALFASQTLLTHSAFAAGFQINEISPGLMGNATAGAAASDDDVSSMFTNPANLSMLKSSQAYLGASEIIPHVSVSNAAARHTVNLPNSSLSLGGAVTGQTEQGGISPSAFVPDGYVGWHINDSWDAGLALVAPYGLKTAYENNSVLRFAALYSSLESIDIVPALSYSVNDQFAIAAGVQAQYVKAKFSNFDGVFTGIAFIDNAQSTTNSTRLGGDSWGAGYTAGIVYTPTPDVRVGLAYRSEVEEHLKGYGEQYVIRGNIAPPLVAGAFFNSETRVLADVTTPAVLTLSAAMDLANWTLKSSAQINFWESFDQLAVRMPDAFATSITIPQQWKNTFFGALGADYRFGSDLTLRAGVAYDETPTQDIYRDPRIPDANRIWASAGLTYILNPQLSIDASYQHIFGEDQTVNVTQAIGQNATTTRPLEVNQVSASYKTSADIVAVAIRYRA